MAIATRSCCHIVNNSMCILHFVCTGVAVVDGKIYILGGEDGWEHFHDTIESYSPTEDKWTPIGEMLTGRSWLSCAPLRVCLPKQSRGKIVKAKR